MKSHWELGYYNKGDDDDNDEGILCDSSEVCV